MKIKFKFIFIHLILFSFVTNFENIKILITDKTDPIPFKKIGQNGAFYLMTDRDNLNSISNLPDIDIQTQFKGHFIDRQENSFIWNCNLNDPEDMNVVIICKIDQAIYKASEYYFSLYNGYIRTKDYAIDIYGGDYYFNLEIKNFNFQLVRSEQQKIDLKLKNDPFKLEYEQLPEKKHLEENNSKAASQVEKDDILSLVKSYNGNENIFSAPDKEETVSFVQTVRDGDKNNEIIIPIKQEDNSNNVIVGENGIIYFVTDYIDNELNIFNSTDIEEKTLFLTTIIDELNNVYNAACRLWKPINDKLRLFCALNEKLNKEARYLKFSETTFEYNNAYNITIKFEEGNLYIIPVEGNVPFIYSDFQEINIQEDIDVYDLKFKMDSYNNELLELFDIDTNFNKKILDNCKTDEKELKCSITKNDIEQILANNGETFILAALLDNYGLYDLNTVLGLKFNYYNVTKENIYVEITKLKEDIGEIFHLITYETNVSSIKNVITDQFPLNFTGYYRTKCFFKKNENTNMLLLCPFESEGNYSLELGYLNYEIDNISSLYNFIILPIQNNEIFTITSDWGYYIFDTHPQILDFTQNDSITITISLSGLDHSYEKYKINPFGDVLECLDGMLLKKCIVPVSHFDYEENGYYNFYYINPRDSLSIFYEVTPFNVKLPERNILKLKIKKEDNLEIIDIGQKGTFYLTTDYNDNITNIFDPFNIEENTEFNTTIIENNENIYNVNCRLWKPTNKKFE